VPRPFPHSNSRARTAGPTHSYTLKIELDELLAFGTLLGHEDVLNNNGDMERYVPELECATDPTKYSCARLDVVEQHAMVSLVWKRWASQRTVVSLVWKRWASQRTVVSLVWKRWASERTVVSLVWKRWASERTVVS